MQEWLIPPVYHKHKACLPCYPAGQGRYTEALEVLRVFEQSQVYLGDSNYPAHIGSAHGTAYRLGKHGMIMKPGVVSGFSTDQSTDHLK